LQGSIKHGQSAEWVVDAWSVNGDVPNADLQLSTSARGLTPEFGFGCGSYDGTGTCHLGSVYSGSTARQVIASVAVPATATAITSVQLTVTESAANLTTDPSVSVTVPVHSGTATNTTSPSVPGTGTSTGGGPSVPGTGTSTGGGAGSSTVSQLPVGSLPTIGSNGSTSSLSPGGNAAGLFPTINPSQVPSPGAGQGTEPVRPVSDSESLPIGTPVIDAQLLGLGALGIAFLLAGTRLSVRKRPAAAMAGGRGAAGAAGTAQASTAWTRAGSAKAAEAEAATADDSTADDSAAD
jgi:hypothetical protein